MRTDSGCRHELAEEAPKNRVGGCSSRVLRPCPAAGKRQAETHCAYVIEPLVALALVRVFCGHRIPHGRSVAFGWPRMRSIEG